MTLLRQYPSPCSVKEGEGKIRKRKMIRIWLFKKFDNMFFFCDKGSPTAGRRENEVCNNMFSFIMVFHIVID